MDSLPAMLEFEDGEHEILFIRKVAKRLGTELIFEMHFLSDHNIISRMCLNGEWDTPRFGLWEKIEDVYRAVQNHANGCEITWHPAYQPGLGILAGLRYFNEYNPNPLLLPI